MPDEPSLCDRGGDLRRRRCLAHVVRTFYGNDLQSNTPSTGAELSFQAYRDNVQDKPVLTPREFIALAQEKGFDSPVHESRGDR